MKKIALIYRLLTLLFLLCVADQSLGANKNDLSGYPLMKGNYWIYRNSIHSTKVGGGIENKICTSKSTVVDVVKRDHLTVAVVKDDQIDCRDEENGKPSDRLIIRAGATTYFEIIGNRVEEILNKVKAPNDSLFGLLREDEEPLLDLPLVLGKMYGDPQSLTRKDQYYCWLVTKVNRVNLSRIKGLKSFRSRKQFTLRYFTLPGELFIDFVPGVGITGSSYKHHGPPDDVYSKLIEFGGGKGLRTCPP
jgi:hypothetical protein